MVEKILRMCKRLKQFSQAEIELISDIPLKELHNILNTLVAENKITYSNGIYFYQKKEAPVKIKNIFHNYNAKTIDLLLRCFCASITSTKTAQIVNIGEHQSDRIFTEIRNLIYEINIKNLNSKFLNKPQKARIRKFFESTAYFYIYNNQVFISDKLLYSDEEISFSEQEIKEFKKIYCYISRYIERHNRNELNIYSKIAEAIWRRDKSFNDLYNELKSLIS